MKVPRLQSLQGKAVALAILLALIAVADLFIIRAYLNRWNESERQSDIVQASQLTSFQLSTDVNHFLQGKKDKLGEVVALINQQDAYLKILAEGGLFANTGDVINPVSRLTAITLKRTEETWSAYKKSVLTLTTHEVWKDSVVASAPIEEVEEIDSLATDSTSVQPEVVTQKVIDPAVAHARTFIDGQWITYSNQFKSLVKDLHEDTIQSKEQVFSVIAIITAVTIILFFAAILLFRQKVIKPLKAIEQAAVNRQHVAKMESEELELVGKGLNQIIDQLNQASSFVQTIGEGNLEVAYNQDDQTISKDKLASSLVSMQSKLKSMNEEEQKRKWANEGVAKFVDILRSSNDNIHILGDRIISTLVHYTGSNQGGLYVYNDEDDQHKFLELISLYAFNTKKFEQQKLKPGEGLVGQAYLEKDTIYLNEIPQDYIRITSGLGEANPKAILVVPLKVDTEVYGLVELATFTEYKPHEIAFVEKLGESLASTLAAVKTNQRNAKLLEESKMAAESMHAQEEEMRQNMEELTATQEEMGRKEKDYLLKISDLEKKLKEPTRGDDWAMAAELERSMQINLEALKIAQQELSKKG